MQNTSRGISDTLTIILSVAAIMGTLGLWLNHEINRVDDRHREDMRAVDARWNLLFEKMDARLNKVEDRQIQAMKPK